MTYEEIKEYVKAQHEESRKRRMKRGMSEYNAEREAYLITLGSLKALYKVRAITDAQFSDLIAEF